MSPVPNIEFPFMVLKSGIWVKVINPVSLVKADRLTGTTGMVGLFKILPAPLTAFQSATTWAGTDVINPALLLNSDKFVGTIGMVGLFRIWVAPLVEFQSELTCGVCAVI